MQKASLQYWAGVAMKYSKDVSANANFHAKPEVSQDH